MPKFLVKGRVRPESEAALADALRPDAPGASTALPPALAAALREGHAARGERYFMLEAESDALARERRALEPFLDVVSVVAVSEVSEREFAARTDDDFANPDDPENE